MSKNLKRCIQILEQHVGQIELVSFGLAPNPNGFCYEILDDAEQYGPIYYDAINEALDALNSDDERTIRELYL